MSDLPEDDIPKGSYAAGRRLRLPAGAEPPIVVYVNGIAQTEGEDYTLRGNDILFSREIVKEELGFARKVAMFFSFFGTYRKNEMIDVQYQENGKTELASDMKVQD
ncbi:MAG: hypothetical protein JJE13_09685 [Thermoleophilia bacterium]|nr:hypothetical protein [Thermoleophilia bacterium]